MGMNGGYIADVGVGPKLSTAINGIPKMKKFALQANPGNAETVWFGPSIDDVGEGNEVLADGTNAWFGLPAGSQFAYDAGQLDNQPSTDNKWLLEIDWTKVVCIGAEADKLHIVYLD
jgi:hypothetical protein